MIKMAADDDERLSFFNDGSDAVGVEEFRRLWGIAVSITTTSGSCNGAH